MFQRVIWTKYEGTKCGCGNTKKPISKYCMECSKKLNLLRSRYAGAKNDETKEFHKKRLEEFLYNHK